MRPALLTLLLPALMTACSTMTEKSPPPPQVPTVRHVDLERYMGKWYVISAVPYFLEKGKVATSDSYRLLGDGSIENIYTFRKKTFDAPEKTWEGTAWVTDHQTNATWKVQLFWPLKAGYRILHLDPDYRWSVVTNGNGQLLWILSKDRHLPEHTYRDIVARIQKDGFDITKLEKVPQPAD